MILQLPVISIFVVDKCILVQFLGINLFKELFIKCILLCNKKCEWYCVQV